ncbi:MAG: DUF4192 domain-containing protein [Marmoricola sp.]
MTPRSYVARGPEDLIALVPYLLGFHPEESVVLLTFGAPAGSFHARVDLPEGAADRAAVAEMLCEAVRNNGATLTAVVIFSSEVDRTRAMCADLVPALQHAGASVLDAIRADGTCWWSVLDAEAEPHPYDVTCHRFTAERVLEGHAAFRNRAELAHTLVGNDPDDVQQVGVAADKVADELLAGGQPGAWQTARTNAAWLRDRLARAAPATERLSVADAGRVLVLVQLVPMRDVACARMSRETAPGHVRLWRDLLRRAPSDLVPGAASLLGIAAWLNGDGALAWCSVDRCREVDADQSLANHLADLLQRAVPPTVWTPLDEARIPLLSGLEQAS